MARDFFKQPLSESELRELLGDTPPADAFAWKSPRARAMNLSPANPPAPVELLRLMAENPYLIRRPVIRLGQRTFFGFNQKQLEQELAR